MSFKARVGSMTFGKGEIQLRIDNRTPKLAEIRTCVDIRPPLSLKSITCSETST